MAVRPRQIGQAITNRRTDKFVNSGEALTSAASTGLGLMQVAEYYARPELEAGTLVEVSRTTKPAPMTSRSCSSNANALHPDCACYYFLVEVFDTPPWRVTS